MTTVVASPYATFSAALLTETLLENKRHDLEEVLARYLELHGLTDSYQLRDDMVWGVAALAELVGVTPKRMFGWIENGRFPHCRPGGTASVAGRRSMIHCYLFTQEL